MFPDANQGQKTILLVLPTILYRCGPEVYYDRQGHNGLRLWLENFDRVILSCRTKQVAVFPPDTVSMQDMLANPALKCEPLPEAWHPMSFFWHLPAAIVRLNRIIGESSHSVFALGGLFGDWGALGALIAAARGRRSAVWTDRVESDVMAFQAASIPGLRGRYHRLLAAATRRYERVVISRSAMGLFHGMDTFTAYAPFSPNPHLVHDIHLGPEARISPEKLTEKGQRRGGPPLRIVYAGRVHPDKGVDDWINVLAKIHELGVEFEASWFGDGPYHREAVARVQRLGLSDVVQFPGATGDREFLMQSLRQADIFLFCHQTPESPRCLIEALLSGTPIIGYDSPFPRDLISENGGGHLVSRGDVAGLATQIQSLWRDHATLTALFVAAAKDGYPHTDVDVFRHRSELIKSL